MTPELANAIIEFAHDGAVHAVAEAQQKLLLLDANGENAILCPPLHNFSEERRNPQLNEASYRAKLHKRIAEAVAVGKICEDIRIRQTDQSIDEFVAYYRKRNPKPKKK